MTDTSALRQYLADARKALDRAEALLAPATNGESLRDWSARWFSERAKRYRNTEHERQRYRLWIAPRMGALAVATISRADVDAWIDHIESEVTAGKLRATTAWRIWTVLRSMMRDASGGRLKALRVRDDNPTAGLRPERGKARASTFLYPSEFLRLVSCAKVPLAFRRQATLAVYLYPRTGELAALEWADVDVATGRIHIHRALDRSGDVAATKTEVDRQFTCERSLMPLLRALRSKGRVCPELGDRKSKGQELRRHLKLAGCKRADLFASDANRRPLTFHDLRATGITWMAMRGDSPTLISERVGHQHLSTTEGYMRRGRLLVAARERVFPALPRCLFGRQP